MATVDGGFYNTVTFGQTVDGGPPDATDPATVVDGGFPDSRDGGSAARTLAGPRWQAVIVAAPSADAAPSVLTHARSRSLTVRLREPSVASFVVDGRSEQAAGIVELATDLVLWRDGQMLFRGRVGATSDDVGPSAHEMQVHAVDYRGLLGRRIVYDDVTYTAAAEQIGWQLITATQQRPGGDLGISRYGPTTTPIRTRTFEGGKPVGEAVQQLSELEDGFDWDITPELVYRVWYPSRGVSSAAVLEYGGSVAAVQRQLDTADFANAHRVSGADGGPSPVVREAADIGSVPQGRFDLQSGFTDISEQATLNARANYLLAQHSTPRAAYTVTLRPGAWGGPQDLWVGDVALLVIRTGRLDVVEAQRVYELTVAIGDDGDETVTATLGRTDPLAAGRHERAVERRLRELERR